MLKIDHVTIAGPKLEAMQQAFANIGMATDYGGPHSNGITHMALLGFNDGSYLELISSLAPGPVETAFWGRYITENGGPCAWAVQVGDVVAEAARIAALGVTVEGPAYYHRRRPDGKLVAWNLAFLGDKGAGATLPFIIKDITPRRWRVQPSASVANSPLTGVSIVVLGVQDMASVIRLFQRVYDWPAPELTIADRFGARLARFRDTPVVLAEPSTRGNWLAERLARFGDSPCAYLIGAKAFEETCKNLQLVGIDEWLGRRFAWFDPTKLDGTMLGIVED